MSTPLDNNAAAILPPLQSDVSGLRQSKTYSAVEQQKLAIELQGMFQMGAGSSRAAKRVVSFEASEPSVAVLQIT